MGEKKIKSQTKPFEYLLELYRSISRIYFGFTMDKLIHINKANEKLINMQIKSPSIRAYFQEIFNLVYDLQELEMELKA
jgi:hypothetical protein